MLLRAAFGPAIVVLAITHASGEQPYVQSLGPGEAYGVSPDGRHVVGNSLAIGNYFWNGIAGMTPISIVPADVSNTGVVVGTGLSRPYRWSATDGQVDLGGLPGNPSGSGGASGISADGSIIVGWSDNGLTSEPFRWTQPGGMVGLGTLPNASTRAEAISSDGSTIFGTGTRGSGISRQTPFFSWTDAAGMVEIGTPGPTGGSAGVKHASADGSHFAGYIANAGDTRNAIRWSQGTFQLLGTLPFSERYWTATCVSADGSIVLGWGSGTSDLGFYWDPVHGMRSLRAVLTQEYGLDLSDWDFLQPHDCSDDARTFVGTGIVAGGNGYEGFIAHIPEPATAILLALPALLALRRKN